MSDEPECLPSTNFLQPHFIAGTAHRLIDCAFRLLRHDIFGTPKAVPKDVMSNKNLSVRQAEKDQASAHIYGHASIQHLLIKERTGLEAILAFQPPQQVRKMSLADQRRWWNDSTRLGEGSLVALVVEYDPAALISLEVSSRHADTNRRGGDEIVSCLVPNAGLPNISMKLATPSRTDLDLLLRIYRDRLDGVLVEFHSLIPAIFVPVLQSLQRMARSRELAFRSWIVPSNDVGRQDRSVLPAVIEPEESPTPLYTRQPGFTFRLDSTTVRLVSA